VVNADGAESEQSKYIAGLLRTGNGNPGYVIQRKERDAFIADAKIFNLAGMEDYIGWSAVE
jgi:hypothetical protein